MQTLAFEAGDSVTAAGTEFNNMQLMIADDLGSGSATAMYDSGSNILTIHVRADGSSTVGDVLGAINALAQFGNAGNQTGVGADNTARVQEPFVQVQVTQTRAGGASTAAVFEIDWAADTITFQADDAGAGTLFNNMSVQFTDDVGAGSESAEYDVATNTPGGPCTCRWLQQYGGCGSGHQCRVQWLFLPGHGQSHCIFAEYRPRIKRRCLHL